jgi:hypothetical protein
MQTASSTLRSITIFYDKYLEIIKTILLKYDRLDKYIINLISIFEIYVRYTVSLKHLVNDESDFIDIFTKKINENDLLPRIDTKKSRAAGIEVLHRYVGNYLIGYPNRDININRESGGRVIAYSAFGSASSRIRRGLLNSDIRPDVFWDIAAKSGDNIEGVPVHTPAFNSLTENDTVIILLLKIDIAKSVTEYLRQIPSVPNIWYYFDVLDYLARYFFYS